jgi:hypothetical protein
MTDHERNAGAPGRGNDCAPLFHRRCDRLFDQDMHPALDACERQFLMKMRGGRDRHGVDTLSQ